MIRRDGTNISLWQQSIEPYSAANKVEKGIRYDVIIVGGGITGITTSLLLQEAGKKCLLLESENIGFGTTGGTTAHLNTLLDTPYNVIQTNFRKEEANLVRAATVEAINLIRSNSEKFRIRCNFRYQHAFLYAREENQKDQLDEIYQSLSDVNLPAEYVENIPVPVPFIKAIKVADQAAFEPLPYIYALAQQFENKGGNLLQGCRLTSTSVNENGIEAETTKGNFQAEKIVYATHTPPGINLLHLRLTPLRSYVLAIELEDDQYPGDLSYDMYDPYHYYRTENVNGKNYLIVGGEDHKTGQKNNTESCFTTLESHTRKYFKVKQVAYKWSAQYFESTDGLPYIGLLPGQNSNVYVATGFGGNGMTYGTVAALILRDMILQNENKSEKIFNPSRVKPIAGFKNFISHNADVVRHFAGKLLSADKLDSLSEIDRGEGKIIKFEGKKIALYKSEEGLLTALVPTCTHMKCDVQWNSTEKSWDCPCHGARYSTDGKVITGPASHNLEQVNLSNLLTEVSEERDSKKT